MNIDYFTTSRVWLSLEYYYNKGITSDRVKEIIENMRDPISTNVNLTCELSGFNGNWIVNISCLDPNNIDYVVRDIDYLLNKELSKMRYE